MNYSITKLLNYRWARVISLTVLLITAVAITASVVYGWTNPTAAPFGGNPPPPVQLQGATPGTVQTGNINISGTGLFGGNIGIGTATPGERLDIQGGNIGFSTEGRQIGFTGPAGFSSYYIRGGTEADGRTMRIGSRMSGANITFQTWDNHFRFNSGEPETTRMIITSGGNVGIGTTAPGARLHVVGEVRATDPAGSIRQWGEGRPGTVRHGTTGVESGLCVNGAIRFGLSLTFATWEGAASACPAGTWVCTRAERGTGICNTTRPDSTCDYRSVTGGCGDDAAHLHWGNIADIQNHTGLPNHYEGEHIREDGMDGGGPGGHFIMPIWCCSN